MAGEPSISVSATLDPSTGLLPASNEGLQAALLHRDDSDWSVRIILKILQCYFESHLIKAGTTERQGLDSHPSPLES